MSRTDTWEYENPVRIVFGRGKLNDLPGLADGRTLIVATEGMTRRGVTARVAGLLSAGGTLTYDEVTSNPTVDRVEDAIDRLRGETVDTIVAVGGGSSIDVGKVLSLALADKQIDLRNFLSGPDAPDVQPLKLIAIPTTAGTGSEVTPFATLWDADSHRKLSLATPRLHPSVALLDADLTLTLPWEATLSPGLDAYAQCFEAIWNRNATPITTSLALRGLDLVPPALRQLHSNLASVPARSDMLEAALLSGLAIAHTRTALAHSMSYPITAHLGLPHGLACALVLPAVLKFNLEADDGRLEDAATRLGFSNADALVPFVINLLRELGANAAIRDFMPDASVLPALAPEMLTPGRADNNLRPLDAEDVRMILTDTATWLA